MGRKPDTLILTYFNRGEKIPDQSNRYSYTCKACGAEFPKGRTNHLLDHLTGSATACPAITTEILTDIVAIQASKSADKARKEALKPPRNELSSPIDGVSTNRFSPTDSLGQPPLPLAQGKNLTGLEALAEASRQVERPLDPVGKPQPHDSNVLGVRDDPIIDPSLNSIGSAAESFPTSAQDLSSIAASASNLQASLVQQLKKHVNNELSSPIDDKENELLHHASTWHVPIRPASEHIADQLAKAATFPVPIAADPYSRLSGLEGLDQPPSKVTKTRSKFSESRRQEVQGVRLKRACIRCRMLRKPCSEEDPCPRCAEIKNPRLWSNSCIRVRISEAFDLYSVGLYAAPAKVALDYCRVSYDIQDRGDTIALRPSDRDEPSVTLPAVTAKLKTGDTVNGVHEDCFMLPKEEDVRIEERLSRYISSYDADYPDEISKTLAYCREHYKDKEPPLLIQLAVSLYKNTHLLTSPTQPFRISHSTQPAFAPPPGNPSPSPLSLEDIKPQITDTSSPPSIAQTALLSLTEKVATSDCRALLNEMEKCLVSRSQTFDLLLASFLFFACVEKMEWVFRSHDTDILFSSSSSTSFPKWVLPHPPQTYARKAEDFSAFLQGLLRSRHVVEPLALDPGSGCLVPVSSGREKDKDREKDKEKEDTGNSGARGWFESVGFGPGLPSRRNALFDARDPRSLDLKHCAGFLLSAQGRGMVGFEE